MERNFVFLHDHDGYHHRRHNKTKLLVHLNIKQSIFEVAKTNHWYIQKIETDTDHIHILLQYLQFAEGIGH